MTLKCVRFPRCCVYLISLLVLRPVSASLHIYARQVYAICNSERAAPTANSSRQVVVSSTGIVFPSLRQFIHSQHRFPIKINFIIEWKKERKVNFSSLELEQKFIFPHFSSSSHKSGLKTSNNSQPEQSKSFTDFIETVPSLFLCWKCFLFPFFFHMTKLNFYVRLMESADWGRGEWWGRKHRSVVERRRQHFL